MREVAPHPAVISMTLAKIEQDTRQREIREAQAAHAAMGKPRFVKAPIAAKNAAIIFVALGIVAWITYQLIIGVIDVILGALGQ